MTGQHSSDIDQLQTPLNHSESDTATRGQKKETHVPSSLTTSPTLSLMHTYTRTHVHTYTHTHKTTQMLNKIAIYWPTQGRSKAERRRELLTGLARWQNETGKLGKEVGRESKRGGKRERKRWKERAKEGEQWWKVMERGRMKTKSSFVLLFVGPDLRWGNFIRSEKFRNL